MTSKSIFAMALAFGCLTLAVQAEQTAKYNGWCDASAAVALDDEHFVVANDEHNELRIYRRGKPDAVGSPVDLGQFLGTKKQESDLEGAARIGNRIYWIGSHGRNKNGKLREERHRFFAMEMGPARPPSLQPLGKAYTGLLDDLLAAESLKPYDLATASTLAPESPGGLNIEGLAATPDGKLLIGFRSPVRNRNALVVSLENPDDVINGRAKARLGSPIPLDLGGAGIRSIELVGSSYWIVAGPPADTGDFALFRWSGKAADRPTPIVGIDFKKYGQFRPEALFAVPNTTLVQILSDDGGVKVGSMECKDLDASKQTFQSITIDATKQ
ncbi:DUF3616 domain-containing protein [Ramlibacter sp. WS9]|uniref:DUF3616 domain-containing protein n=1 Tax=Ramlibacter sp. WS9 TaxID=1882741 RepID=UPI001144C3A2|nr:DUF3616 domain-containing protein [Ramlibacter sp. WS9]ROZ78805.1 DUF3616 domain-containing protein [Ramlibacter sp. WS9]